MLAVAARPSHILHLLLTIVTGGLWLIVWLFLSSSGKQFRCPYCGDRTRSMSWAVRTGRQPKAPTTFGTRLTVLISSAAIIFAVWFVLDGPGRALTSPSVSSHSSNSSTLARLAASTSTSTDAGDQGRADRAEWETWVSGLGSSQREGAIFWAGQRSLARPGSCTDGRGASRGAWTSGCLEARARLSPIDARRKAAPAYRQGWNSVAADTASSTPATEAPGPSKPFAPYPTIPEYPVVMECVRTNQTGAFFGSAADWQRACLTGETQDRAWLAGQWLNYSPSLRARCVSARDLHGDLPVSYSKLRICLEMGGT